MRINVSSSVSGDPIAGPLVAAIHRELATELDRLAAAGLKYWRRITPKRTGRLRGSLRVHVSRASPQRHTLAFDVGDPGRAYYGKVARRHRALRGARGVLKWIDKHTPAAVDRAITRAVERP